MTMVGAGILVLGWLASVASLTVMIVGASIIVCAGLIGLLTARRLKVTQGINGLLLILFMMSWQYAHAQEDMSAMWKGESHVKQSDSLRGAIFREGRYAMFVHWGYYSLLANRWEGKTYYGIGEWLMNKNMAGIPVEEYKKNVGDFNPTGFNADSIVELAKRAGMKYIVITSKHHDGFAMFHSKYSRFNIFDATPFKRDPMKEMAVACHNAGLGLGFYYSQTQDWTTVGGHAGAVSFDDYFHHRCLPEVEQLTTEYGPIALVWFDTPGNIRKEYAQALVDIVHKNQPAAFVSGRVGHGLGDYSTLGDMEIPRQNIGGLWETVEVTNDGWGYSWYDENWKTPQQVLHMLLSTIARGGNFMLNIGPKGDGTVPAVPKAVLLRAGQWIQQHPDLVYQGERSPWQHAMPWGDAIVQKNKLSLVIFNWPPSGKLYVPGLRSRVVSVQMLIKGQVQPLPFSKQEGWLVIQTPEKAPEPLVQVIELECDGRPNADSTLAIDPEQTTNLDVLFAGTGGGAILKGDHWMEKFGEWKNAKRIVNWTAEGKASWTVDVVQPGYYQASLQYKGDSRLVWKIEVNPGTAIQNNQNATNAYAWYPIGWLQFTRPGRYSLSVSLVEGNGNTASLAAMRLQPINF
jgi:alpha-L-fucosidase